jgi:molybdopterin synthase sulfur carrier subunit
LEVEVKYYAMLREASGRKREVFEVPEGSSVGDLMDLIVGKYGDPFHKYVYDSEKQVRDYLSFMLNGVSVSSLEGFGTALGDGDVLAILPPIGGG